MHLRLLALLLFHILTVYERQAAGTQQNGKASPPGSAAVTSTTPPPTSAARGTQPLQRWQTGTMMAAVAAIGLAAWQ